MIVKSIQLLFMTYTIFLMIRIVGSWFPAFAQTSFMRFISHYTDPYLNIFRRLIPPIGGRLDLSPILAYFGLQIVQNILLSFFR